MSTNMVYILERKRMWLNEIVTWAPLRLFYPSGLEATLIEHKSHNHESRPFLLFVFSVDKTTLHIQMNEIINRMFTFLWAGPGCLGDSGLSACASFRRHPKHCNTRQCSGLLPSTLQLLRRRSFNVIQKHHHRPARPGRQAPDPEMDTWGHR